jgi:hypothetical protein
MTFWFRFLGERLPPRLTYRWGGLFIGLGAIALYKYLNSTKRLEYQLSKLNKGKESIKIVLTMFFSRKH